MQSGMLMGTLKCADMQMDMSAFLITVLSEPSLMFMQILRLLGLLLGRPVFVCPGLKENHLKC